MSQQHPQTIKRKKWAEGEPIAIDLEWRVWQTFIFITSLSGPFLRPWNRCLRNLVMSFLTMISNVSGAGWGVLRCGGGVELSLGGEGEAQVSYSTLTTMLDSSFPVRTASQSDAGWSHTTLIRTHSCFVLKCPWCAYIYIFGKEVQGRSIFVVKKLQQKQQWRPWVSWVQVTDLACIMGKLRGLSLVQPYRQQTTTRTNSNFIFFHWTCSF